MSIENTFAMEKLHKYFITVAIFLLTGALLLIKEFATHVSLINLVKKLFQINGHATCLKHTDPIKLLQMIYQIITAYFKDDCVDELTGDPVLTAIL